MIASCKVLLISAGIFHPPLLGRIQLGKLLARARGVELLRGRSLELLKEMDCTEIQALVLYYHQKSLSTAALDALDSFVSAGGGVLAIHSATASFKEMPDYCEILGGRFTGHGPIEQITIEAVHSRDEIFREIPSFTILDELYLHEFTGEVRPHFVVQQGEHQIPIVWTRQHGQGSVCYVGLGHRTKSMRLPSVQTILIRGLAWVCGAMAS